MGAEIASLPPRRERHKQASYHPLIWSLILGTAFTRTAAFMSLPFLAIYLDSQTGLNPFQIGLVLSMSGLGGALGGFIGGYLSDLLGRRLVLLSSMITWTAMFFCFLFAQTYLHFMLLNFMHGLCRSFFDPTSQAMMADLTPETKRMKIFGYRYTSLNIGLVLGPLLGAVLFPVAGIQTFFYTGIAFLAYTVILILQFIRYDKQIQMCQPKGKVRLRDCVSVILKDRALAYFVSGGILFFAVYAQIESNLPLHLSKELESGKTLFPFLLAMNAVLVILLQGFAANWAQKKNILSSLLLGSLLFSAGFSAFAVGGNELSYVLGIILLTLGEILVFPVSNRFIDQLADERLRGTYYGAFNFSQIGLFIGPILGGWLLKITSGEMMWWIMTIISLHIIWFFAVGYRKYAERLGIGILQIIQRIFYDLHLAPVIRFTLKMIPVASLTCGFVFGIYHYIHSGLSSPPRTKMVEVNISKGASIREVARELEQKKIIRNESVFLLYYWGYNTLKNESIQPGVYQISPSMKIKDVLFVLSKSDCSKGCETVSKPNDIHIFPSWLKNTNLFWQ
ncbi:MDR family MFS transporter [Lihuaxuella thermophila]|uniref:Predicted arabinose efflux permease, MFS family n=1 Tax=Lihuaxuella thermophila TaxID=1173111 RepID=A0A1H8ITJ7_9BACL|nr:MFS transporter [Lihuaxuella thermophila]SEN71904.1 Predicted arabinose efflux permease, MFS family [Lihuaxuella thermophila]